MGHPKHDHRQVRTTQEIPSCVDSFLDLSFRDILHYILYVTLPRHLSTVLENNQQPIDSDEEILLEQGKRIRALHEIISRPDLSFEQQIDETLRLGCQLLGTEIGKVGRQDPETNTSEFLNTVVLRRNFRMFF